jgi:hypothetical protein
VYQRRSLPVATGPQLCRLWLIRSTPESDDLNSAIRWSAGTHRRSGPERIKAFVDDDLPPNRTRLAVALSAVAALISTASIAAMVFNAPDAVLAGLATALATTLGLLGFVIHQSRR